MQMLTNGIKVSTLRYLNSKIISGGGATPCAPWTTALQVLLPITNHPNTVLPTPNQILSNTFHLCKLL